MGKGDYLGEFEQICLLAVIILRENAYGVTILEEIEGRTGREPNIGAIYATLDRLEKKGFVSSKLGENTAGRSGRPKRYFKIEAPGVDALNRTRQMSERMWEGVAAPAFAAGWGM
ncbi:MAG: helix-turn-helix transcriptional regulator [Pseudomonadota bacterium]